MDFTPLPQERSEIIRVAEDCERQQRQIIRLSCQSFPPSIIYWGGSKKFEDFTTTDVCELILKPIVRDERCSYCEYLENNGEGHLVHVASVFISHAWKYTTFSNLNHESLCTWLYSYKL